MSKRARREELRREEARLIERALRLGFFVGLTELELQPARVVFEEDAGAAGAVAVLEVAMVPGELRRVEALSRRLGLPVPVVMKRAVLLGQERFNALDLDGKTAAARAAEESLRC